MRKLLKATAALVLVLGLGACTAVRVPAGRTPARPAPRPAISLAQFRQLHVGMTQLQTTQWIDYRHCHLSSSFDDGMGDVFTDYDCENGAPWYSGCILSFQNDVVTSLGEWGLS